MSARLRPPDDLMRALRWTATPGGLTALFIAGFLLRVLLGLGGGFPADTAIFQNWAARLAETGPGGFYAPGYFADYPPGYLYVLWPLGVLSKALFAGVPPVFLVKLPGMVADVGLAYVVMALAATVASAAGVDRWWVRPAAAAAILFNPPVIFLSAVWGQVDTVAALYSLAAVLLVVRGPGSWKHEAGGAALLALAFATKPQTGFLVPVVGLVLIVRHLTRDGSGADKALRLGVPPLAFLATWIALGIPFGLGLGGLLEFYQDAGSVYPYTSVWAFNFWGIAGFWRPDSGADAFRVLGAPAVAVAVTAFGAGACYVLIRVFRALRARLSEAEVILAGGAAVVCLSFAVLTRIHERYLFLALACLAPLIVYPLVRALFAALALMFMLNLYFPWVYYVEQADRTTLKVDSLFRLFYGTANDSPNKKLLSLVTVAVCLLVAFKVWDFLKETAPSVARAETPPKPVEDSARPRWGLHPIGTRAAAIAGILFLVLVPTRLAGLGTPQGMYFDEIYHARTAGEYLAGKESYEWTHPPLGKELMALSIDAFSGWGADEGGSGPDGMTAGVVDSDGTTVAWATSGGDRGEVHIAPLGTGCAVGAATATAAVPFVPSHVAVAASGGAFVAGTSGGGFAAARYTGSERVWQTPLDAAPVDIAAAGESLFLVDERGTLSMVGASGEVLELSSGAGAVAFDATSGGVWASFPNDRTVSAYDAQGTTLGSVQTYEGADHLVVVAEADRLLALDVDTGLLESIENEQRTWLDRMETPAQTLAAIPDKGLAYAVDGRHVDVLEPRGLTVIGETDLPSDPVALVPIKEDGRLMAVTSEGSVSCVSGENAFAWRLPGALFGALLPALVFLLALRLTGSRIGAGLAAAFVALEGLAFSISRIAILDSQATSLIVLSWLAALSVMYHAAGSETEDRVNRGPGLAWLAVTGIALGLSIATKWVGIYSFLMIAALFAGDLIVRQRRGVAGLFPSLAVAVPVIALMVVGVPIAIYLLSYIPYFSLGHSFGELARLQKAMYEYHAELKADHPYASPWYGWPVGHRAVALFSGARGTETAEIWSVANPVVLVGGLWGMAVAAMAAWRWRLVALAILPLAALTQYLPWARVSRVVFIYHYLPVVPFLAIALGWALGKRIGRTRYGVNEAAVVVAAAVVVFAITLPELDGWYVSPEYHSSLKSWFSWLY